MGHHGQPVSNSEVMVHALRPRVSIISNGTRKGGQPDAMRVVLNSPGLEDVWQYVARVPRSGPANCTIEGEHYGQDAACFNRDRAPQDRVIVLTCRKLQHGGDVVGLQVGTVLEDLFAGRPRSQAALTVISRSPSTPRPRRSQLRLKDTLPLGWLFTTRTHS